MQGIGVTPAAVDEAVNMSDAYCYRGGLVSQNYRLGADNLQALMADRGDDGREICDQAACYMSRS